jgi:hypothetical protein
MWRIFHKLFNYHYIAMVYAYDREVFKVRFAPNGMVYVKAYGEIILRKDWVYWEPLTFKKDEGIGE